MEYNLGKSDIKRYEKYKRIAEIIDEINIDTVIIKGCVRQLKYSFDKALFNIEMN